MNEQALLPTYTFDIWRYPNRMVAALFRYFFILFDNLQMLNALMYVSLQAVSKSCATASMSSAHCSIFCPTWLGTKSLTAHHKEPKKEPQKGATTKMYRIGKQNNPLRGSQLRNARNDALFRGSTCSAQ
ncbi:MAG: hypothetical protein LBO71_02645 [Prevotellaceae bacterium]|jgi:hypothetical protein|nr:hypothetical protein [Prevotellaceae bacterium]